MGNLITIYYSIDYELSVFRFMVTNEMGKIKYGHHNNGKFCLKKKQQQNFHIDTYTSMKLEQLRILATFLQGL